MTIAQLSAALDVINRKIDQVIMEALRVDFGSLHYHWSGQTSL